MAYPCDKNTYYYQNTLTPGTGLLNQSFYIGSNGGVVQDGYYSDGSYVYTVVSGVVTSVVTVANCGTIPTPTPILYYEYNFAFRASAALACSAGTDPGQLVTRYSNANSSDLYGPGGIVNYSPQSDVYTFGYYLYTDTGLSSPVNNGYYSDGTYYFRVNGSGASAGLITAAGYC